MNKPTYNEMLEAGVHYGHLKESGILRCSHTFSWKEKEYTSLTLTEQLSVLTGLHMP